MLAKNSTAIRIPGQWVSTNSEYNPNLHTRVVSMNQSYISQGAGQAAGPSQLRSDDEPRPRTGANRIEVSAYAAFRSGRRPCRTPGFDTRTLAVALPISTVLRSTSDGTTWWDDCCEKITPSTLDRPFVATPYRHTGFTGDLNAGYLEGEPAPHRAKSPKTPISDRQLDNRNQNRIPPFLSLFSAKFTTE